MSSEENLSLRSCAILGFLVILLFWSIKSKPVNELFSSSIKAHVKSRACLWQTREIRPGVDIYGNLRLPFLVYLLSYFALPGKIFLFPRIRGFFQFSAALFHRSGKHIFRTDRRSAGSGYNCKMPLICLGLPDVSGVTTNLYLSVMNTNPCASPALSAGDADADLLGAKYTAVSSQLFWDFKRLTEEELCYYFCSFFFWCWKVKITLGG